MKKTIKIIIAVIVFFFFDFVASSFLRNGLDEGIGINKHAKILIVGHSHLMMALDRRTMEKSLNCNVAKHTNAGVGVEERMLMTRNFLDSKYSDSLKLVVIGVDPFLFNEEDLSLNAYTLFYPWIDEPEVGEYLKRNVSTVDYFAHKIFRLSRFTDDTMKQSLRGWKHDDRNYKSTIFTNKDFEERGEKWKRKIKFDVKMQNMLEDNIKLLTNKKIHVILLQTPLLQELLKLDKINYIKICDYYSSLDKKNEYVNFLNLAPSFCDSEEIFFDPVHVNFDGQKKITKLVNDYIKQYYKFVL